EATSRRFALRPPGDAQLVLRVPDALLELPPVGLGLAEVDPLELVPRLLELAPRPLVVDLERADRVVDERERAVLLHLEESRACRELLDLGLADVDPRRPRLQQGDEGRVPREHADLAGSPRHDQHLRLALPRRAL